MTGCSMNKMANAPSDYLGKPQTAAKSAHDARDALEAGKVSKAVRLAEQAVAASPRDGSYRALLGQAYLNDGRFASATAALTEALELGTTDSNTIIALTLAQIAQGKNAEAVTLLERSEEHTSELQSLMRISYAVFCLKKKKNTNKQLKHNHPSMT